MRKITSADAIIFQPLFRETQQYFISRDNTRNNHVNRERKTNYILNLISNNTDVKHDTCCWHNIEHDCYHAWYVLLEQHCSRLLVHEPWTVLFEHTWTTLLITMFTGCSTTLFTPVPNSTVQACWQPAAGCAFLRVLITQQVEIYRVSGHYNEKNTATY